MHSNFYLFLTVGSFIIYLSVLIYKQKIYKIPAVLLILIGLGLILYYPITMMSNDAENQVETVEAVVQGEEETSETNFAIVGEPESQKEQELTVPTAGFEGDEKTAQYYAGLWYQKAIDQWVKRLGQYQQPDSVIYFVEKAIYYYPFAEAYNVKGQVLVQKGKMKEGIKSYKLAILLDSTKGQPYFNLGSVYFMMNQLQPACENWSKAYKLGLPNAGEALQMYCQ